MIVKALNLMTSERGTFESSLSHSVVIMIINSMSFTQKTNGSTCNLSNKSSNFGQEWSPQRPTFLVAFHFTSAN